jgi:dihydroorotase
MSYPHDLLIINGTVVTAAGRRQADVAISNGRIAAVGERHQLDGQAADVLDASGQFVLPGVIDGHVHFRQPGLEHKETWLTGSRGAVHGGVTTVIEMPNSEPPTRSVKEASAKLALAGASSYCDFGLFGLLDRDSSAGAEELIRSRLVIGLKVFLGPSTGALVAPPDAELVRLLRLAAAAGLRTAFHAEDAATLRRAGAAVAERSDPRAHLDGRPVEAEVLAIEYAAQLLSQAGAPGHILHLSSAAGVEAVRRWRSRGVDLTCEVTPHHLLLGDSAYDSLGGLVKVNPPVRGGDHAAALMAALVDGTINCLASDHAPHAPAEKESSDIRQVEAGVAGVETLTALLLTLVDSGRLSLERAVTVSSEGPARAWGLWPTKGSLEPGADADIIVVELAVEGVIRGSELHGMHPLTPFEGRPTHGRVTDTLVRGRLVVRETELVGQPGWGRQLVRAATLWA